MAKSKTSKTEVKENRRTGKDRRSETCQLPDGQPERRKVARRRQIDPTTCERDYSNDEIEFMQALDAYKRSSGRMFPTCSEILEVVRALGYERVARIEVTEDSFNHKTNNVGIKKAEDAELEEELVGEEA